MVKDSGSKMFYIPIFKMENLRITMLCGCIADIRGNNTPIFHLVRDNIFHLAVRDTQKKIPLPSNLEFYEEFALPDPLLSLLLQEFLIKSSPQDKKTRNFSQGFKQTT